MRWCFLGRARSAVRRDRAARSAVHAGSDFWNSRHGQRRRRVRDVPCRLAHSPICAAAAPRAATVRWASTRRLRWVLTTGTSKTCACGSNMRAMPGLPRGSVIFSLKQDAMRSAICREMPGSCRSRCTGGGAGGEVTTRPRHWLMGWRDGLNLPVHQPLRRVIATERLAHKGRTARAEVMRRCVSMPGPVVNWLAARCSWLTTF